MDLNNLFSLFNILPGDDFGEEVEEYKNTPKFKLGMFVKLLRDGSLFKKKIVSFFAKANSDLDKEDISNAGDFMMYTRAWYWISQFDFSDPEWCEEVLLIDYDELLISLNISIIYFENLEEYEKCATLVKIRSLLE